MRFINALSYKSADYLMRQMKIVIGALFKGLLLLVQCFAGGDYSC